jgi:hypothetical protein
MIGPKSAELWNEFKDNLFRAKRALDVPAAETRFYALPFEMRALCYMVADRWQTPGHHDHEVLAQDIGIALDMALNLSNSDAAALTPSTQPKD